MRRLSALALAVAVPALLVAAPSFSVPPTPHAVTPHVERVGLTPADDERASTTRQPTAEAGDIVTAAIPAEPFTVFGVTWEGDSAGVSVRVRVRETGEWTDWQTIGVADAYPDNGSADANRAVGRNATEPLVSPGADAFQVEVDAPANVTMSDVEALLIDPGSSDGDTVAGGTRGGTAVAAVAAPRIISRAEWGADENLRLTACPEGPSYSNTIKVGFVHHTAGANEYTAEEVPAILRGIYAFHVEGRLWCDVGYNFFVDKFGRVFEGRFGGTDRAVVGAHTGGFNTDTFGIALLGTYTKTPLPAAAQESLETVLSWKLGQYSSRPPQTATLTSAGADNSRYTAGQVVTFRTISGHRDASFTECPGEMVYALLPSIGGRLTFSPVVFESLGGRVSDRPGAASWLPSRIDVVARGSDGRVMHTWSDGIAPLASTSQWMTWESLGGVAAAGPAVSAWAPGRLDVFVPGTDGALWHRWYDGAWSQWESLGGQTTTAAASVAWSAGRLDVFVKGTDNRLWHRFYESGWSGWEDLSASLTLGTPPAAASWASGRLDVVATDIDQQIWHRSYQAGVGWGPWESLDGLSALPPGITAFDQRLIVLVTGLDNQIWMRTWNAGWGAWRPLGGVAKSGPGASTRAGHGDVFVHGGDDAVWHRALLD